jgi:hypothetical protein
MADRRRLDPRRRAHPVPGAHRPDPDPG